MAEERDITIRQNSIASIFDVILAVSLLEIFSVREVVITKFECIWGLIKRGGESWEWESKLFVYVISVAMREK